jgi:hypothetical protein
MDVLQFVFLCVTKWVEHLHNFQSIVGNRYHLKKEDRKKEVYPKEDPTRLT